MFGFSSCHTYLFLASSVSPESRHRWSLAPRAPGPITFPVLLWILLPSNRLPSELGSWLERSLQGELHSVTLTRLSLSLPATDCVIFTSSSLNSVLTALYLLPAASSDAEGGPVHGTAQFVFLTRSSHWSRPL